MEALDYIRRFKMLARESNYSRIDFLDCLFEDFSEYAENERRWKRRELKYHEWHAIVSNYYQKFSAIARLRRSLRKDGEGLTQKLWGFFYINYLVPDRDRLFPKEAREIYDYKRNQLRHVQDKNYNYENRQGNPGPSR